MPFQAKLTTKLEKYSVDDTIVELTNDVDAEQLNEIVKNLLRSLDKLEGKDHDELTGKNFDFLVGGRILKLNVEKHLELYEDEIDAKEILSEKLVEIEYLLSLKAPEPKSQFHQDDWVSCLDANESYIISGSYDKSIRIFSVQKRVSLMTIEDAHDKPITRVKLVKSLNDQTQKTNSNEVYFVSCGHDEVSILHKVNVKTGVDEALQIFSGHNRSVNCVDCNDNLMATGSFDKTLRLWSLAEKENEQITGDENDNSKNNGVDEDGGKTKKKQKKIKSSEKSVSKIRKSAIMTLTGHQESITGVKWLGSCNEYNSLATCSMDRAICVWDVEVAECKRRVLSAKPLLGLDYSPENNLFIAASCDRHVRTWDSRAPDNSTAKTAYTSHGAWVSSVAFGGQQHPNNFISGGYDNLVKLWDLRSPKACLYDMIGHHDKVLDVNWCNPGVVLSSSADSTIKMFQI